MQNVHELTLILVQPLCLAVENRAGIHLNTVVFFNIFCEAKLVLMLDVHKLRLRLLVVRIDCKLFKMA